MQLIDPRTSEDLWKVAASTLGEDLKDVVDLDQPSRRAALEIVLFEAREKRKQCLIKRWKLKNRKGDVIILRDIFEKIITCADAFKSAGDAVIDLAPGWAAIPWAVVGFLLKVRDNFLEPTRAAHLTQP